ncbi:hypothetical protein JCM15765_01120 [Paradesulfitobacterium aromaticivorans]
MLTELIGCSGRKIPEAKGSSLLVFALGKSPVFRVDRAGAAIIGASLTIGTGVISFDQAAQSIEQKMRGK